MALGGPGQTVAVVKPATRGGALTEGGLSGMRTESGTRTQSGMGTPSRTQARGGMTSLSGREPGAYQPHALHAGGRTYLETNCYTDIIVELLHACGYEPLAMLGFLVRMDFEGDQWTFFKPPPEDLELLFGLDIHEMQPYRPLPVQIAEQIDRGRTMIVELDAFHLPDTASTSYRAEHVKTSVVADAIDIPNQVFRYFHNAGLYELRDADFRGVFRLGEELGEPLVQSPLSTGLPLPVLSPPSVLPPYTELVRFDVGLGLQGEALRETALGLLARHLGKRPRSNPFERFGEHLIESLPALLEAGLADYHDYAFATVRMAGSAFELAASHAQWLLGEHGARATAAMGEIVGACKVLGFKLARRRPFDPEPMISGLASAWTRATGALEEEVG